MGNWRTVHIDGTLDADQVEAAKKTCRWDMNSRDYANMPSHALAYSPSLCGLNDWPATRMSAIGNCFERDFSVEDVADALRKIMAVAPSLRVKVHCGGEYEDKKCVATITAADGNVTIGDPEVGEIPDIGMAQMMGNLAMATQRSTF